MEERSNGLTNERGIDSSSKRFLTASLITLGNISSAEDPRGERDREQSRRSVLPNSRDKVQGTARRRTAERARRGGKGSLLQEVFCKRRKKEGWKRAGKRICRLLARFSSLFRQQERLVVLIPVLVRCTGNPPNGRETRLSHLTSVFLRVARAARYTDEPSRE